VRGDWLGRKQTKTKEEWRNVWAGGEQERDEWENLTKSVVETGEEVKGLIIRCGRILSWKDKWNAKDHLSRR
jgi:hypothetical protein